MRFHNDQAFHALLAAESNLGNSLGDLGGKSRRPKVVAFLIIVEPVNISIVGT